MVRNLLAGDGVHLDRLGSEGDATVAAELDDIARHFTVPSGTPSLGCCRIPSIQGSSQGVGFWLSQECLWGAPAAIRLEALGDFVPRVFV